MGELEDLIAEIGVKQWVKNLFVDKLSQFNKAGNKDVDEFVAEFNVMILKEFKMVARETIGEVLEQASVIMNKEKS